MATWTQFASEAPDLATLARRLLEQRVHKTIATLRRDGSPRISGIEAFFAQDDVWFGSMAGAVKALDLQRDARYALHGGSVDPPDWRGDAKLAGRAEEVTDDERRAAVFAAHSHGPPSAGSHLFRADLHEVVVTRLGEPADHLVIERWAPGAGVRRLERR